MLQITLCDSYSEIFEHIYLSIVAKGDVFHLNCIIEFVFIQIDGWKRLEVGYHFERQFQD